ncbi:non-specific lipid transfer protein GPI-anchored 20-like [Malania oleifera]|uniref:non-specific lipid transfer protein GPI-anchored 20-like n=1 Tax=Malania oleifera TaxID=397392 RepID=UPI0025AE8EE9|nr:non-specific lipid transfer protein GPI-anchored 20-like [Malania oleifera]
MNFVTNNTTNGTSLNAGCCSSLRSLVGNDTGCICFIVAGSVPIQLPINRTLAIFLLRACNMPRVPVPCNASGAPILTLGPNAFGPVRSLGLFPPLSPQGNPLNLDRQRPISPPIPVELRVTGGDSSTNPSSLC